MTGDSGRMSRGKSWGLAKYLCGCHLRRSGDTATAVTAPSAVAVQTHVHIESAALTNRRGKNIFFPSPHGPKSELTKLNFSPSGRHSSPTASRRARRRPDLPSGVEYEKSSPAVEPKAASEATNIANICLYFMVRVLMTWGRYKETERIHNRRGS